MSCVKRDDFLVQPLRDKFPDRCFGAKILEELPLRVDDEQRHLGMGPISKQQDFSQNRLARARLSENAEVVAFANTAFPFAEMSEPRREIGTSSVDATNLVD